MSRLPHKKYQRLCSRYAKAVRRAARLEILLSELVNAQLTDEQRLRRDIYPCSNEGNADGLSMRSFVVPLGVELDRWRDEEGGEE